MPISYSKYPADWKAISLKIRERSGGRCECHGLCGLHRNRRCEERNGEKAKWAKGKIILTVAHLNHDIPDVRDENLRAMCQRCHLRYDVKHHQKNAAETRRKKRIIQRLCLRTLARGSRSHMTIVWPKEQNFDGKRKNWKEAP